MVRLTDERPLVERGMRFDQGASLIEVQSI